MSDSKHVADGGEELASSNQSSEGDSALSAGDDAFKSAQDQIKQVIALATGTIALTITFAKAFLVGSGSAVVYAEVAWVALLLSLVAGLFAMSALTGARATGGNIMHRTIKIPAGLQIITFLLGILLVVVFGVVSLAATGADADDDSVRMHARLIENTAISRRAARLRLHSMASNEMNSANCSMDSGATRRLDEFVDTGAENYAHTLSSEEISSAELGHLDASRQASEAVFLSELRGACADDLMVTESEFEGFLLAACPIWPFC